MRRLASILVAHALLCAAAPARAQQPQPSPSRQQQQQSPPSPQRQQPPTAPEEVGDDEVVRITTNLVQMDVVVTDKKGKLVTDLRAEDFEILEDGRAQQITNFSYVSNAPAAAPAEAEARRTRETDRLAPPVPPARLRPEQVRRTIALVVDDLGLSFETTHYARRALKKFVDEQMQPNDLVAIIRTSAGVGALQQFTSDKRQLYAAIERVKWYPTGRGGVGIFQPVERDLSAESAAAAERMRASSVGRAGGGARPGAADTSASRAGAEELNDFREELFAVGTLGALNFVVRGMRELPGRKSVLLFSEGFALYTPDRGRGRSDRVLQSLRRLTDLANRASVVVYAMDVRGLVYTGLTAADDVGGLTPQQLEEHLSGRSQQLFDTQSGLSYLAQQTGGLFIRNTNDLAGGVRRVLEDQSGYYLIGYRPAGETFDRRYHRLSAKVKNRPDLKVRTRTGFYGVPDEDLRPVRRTPQQQLMAALMSPFSSGDIDLRLATFFTATQAQQPIITSQMHLDMRDLKFTQQPDGIHAADLDLVGVAFGDNGTVVDSRAASQTLRLPPDTYERALRSGLVYTFTVPVKKAGAYQLRMAVRDAATGHVGSASQFVEVPDLKKKRLALSGIVLSGMTAKQAAAARAAAQTNAQTSAQPAAQANAQASAQASAQPTAQPTAQPGAQPSAAAASQSASGSAQDGAAEAGDPEANTAVRRFRHGMLLDFAYIIFNARADKATARPHLTTQTRLFRDGQPVFTGEERPAALGQQLDPRRLVVVGRIQLGTNLAPGEYVLQVVVTDALAKPNDKHRTTTQWIDFEIVK